MNSTTQHTANAAADKNTAAYQQAVNELVDQYCVQNSPYYRQAFARISGANRFILSFNLMAALLGPVWFAARGLWNWFLVFVLLEAFACIQISLGLFSDLGAESKLRAERISATLEQRREQLASAIETGSGNVEGLTRIVNSLENAVQQALQQAQALETERMSLLIFGLAVMAAFKLIQGLIANQALEKHFTLWRSDRYLPHGISSLRGITGLAIVATVYGLASAQFSFPTTWSALQTFPAPEGFRTGVSSGLKEWFDYATVAGSGFFNNVTDSVRVLLDGLETLFVGTPWPVVILFIALLAWQCAGPRVAIFAVAGLMYLGFLGFWDKAMATVSLLGAAACVSISLGIPMGILCARKPRVYTFIRPVLDFMQTMPSFVYLIPIIAFFGTGKPAAILATLVFGSPPVIRLTVLGLQGVPEHVREAAISFGATPAYLLFKVDLPLAAKTIMTGVNQTIMMSLAMVVIASLIGAKGLGEDVLEALQYASTGEGILAGFAILICSMILDRIIQGKR
ncbi:ABC transporter permease [Aliamphritea hakodatensis]|uniref:ABC transporter permease n=1 Tax=Aliamphritea hakodatensis TaxID=2895352 RepID=UPI0022FDACB1|nr:ABC transporter permease subunit [Aliamphritea hakodatensis]